MQCTELTPHFTERFLSALFLRYEIPFLQKKNLDEKRSFFLDDVDDEIFVFNYNTWPDWAWGLK